MLVIPAIDLKDGRCVRLRQGDMAAETVYSDDVTEVASRWQQQGAGLIHVVDLNGAVDGEPKNLPHIESVMKAVRVKVQVGGGIRTIDTVRRYLNAGVSRVVLGTAALTNRALLDLACQEFPQRIVLGLDARDGRIAVKGWTTVSDVRAIDLLKELSGCAIAAVVYTDIARDGMLNGPNIPALKEVVEYSSFPVIASGGITRLEDLQAVRSLGQKIEGAIVGKALYDGKLDLKAAVAALGKE
ncbi:MAG: 1-(5-phosphoribosyl)-5-[(5-phosphoribosylamino)methylideneamino]imidazole-4-carboxamide isomerase [Nitrospira sp.]|nr:1-(5-phosphoribosyl)-5-[(5-phosphoribosylamino)methylideneamino]imidazole-4-carboxamide isomerase [Nitrospira sp.]MDH4251450.1 1-(5-phosphoribosyl)-5-[(5-phosphoribosylamino)methylideneamino]imidazole-4-carboxamide isomerase [Nitrospira sp.]MDH4344322.1 1-(5-phosphoribosyl)-5-[(5-phosphoribosylamino)methylideneamino]imidazole-4-carboxamide isomerase [Nitrospira sp.]MDH5335346.1 1-(5-phosphoribosyl)-5-[(5-phosphoribosylamino)methylideneamino]imidazole-4-carboxamide isomerase [Nitrospira sp.]